MNVLVCVTQQKTCERLINRAVKLAHDDSKIIVLCVTKPNWKLLNNTNEGEALQYLFNVAKKVGAELSVLHSENIIKTIVSFAKDNDISHIVMGMSPKHSENKFNEKLISKLPKIVFKVFP